jgi:hypothetical protein
MLHYGTHGGYGRVGEVAALHNGRHHGIESALAVFAQVGEDVAQVHAANVRKEEGRR